ncbi:MAG: isocitrate lyase/PEP mutase family protein [Candidatus Binatia bacterium]|nr:isocitrate lyase/PEP mutase family protein [Candidatus Binatia bacterium]
MHGRERMQQLLLRTQGPLVMGGIYDGISARLAHNAGFEAMFIGGFSVAASLLGEPDIGLLTQTEMADAARRLCRLTDRPVLVDADTGYGSVANVQRTVELYHRAGAAGLFLEDQVWPKRCGHMRGKQVVDADEWLAKLRAVREHPLGNELFLVARTDALAVLGLDEALRRARAALEAGADAVFVEAPESIAELGRIGREVPGIKVANMVEFGRTPLLSPEELFALGFQIIVTPLAPLLSAARALAETYSLLRAEGTLRNHLQRLFPLERWFELVGYRDP